VPAPARRLLAVSAVAHPGGAETTLLRLLGALRRRGWEVTLTTPGPGPLADAGRREGLEVERLPVGPLRSRRGPGPLRASPGALAAWPRARRLAAAHDVCYLNGGVCGRLLPALAGRRTVLHIHDMVERVPRHWRRATVVFAASGAVAERLRPLHAEVVYGPVDPDPPPITPPWPAGGGPIVGFVGRIEPRKGPLDLVRAAPLIRERVPGVRILIIGGDPYGAEAEYVARVRDAEGVEFYGWVERADSLMRHLDVLVLPARREPFGTVLSEAMAVGTPVVASRVDGLPEVVDDGVSGALVEPGDVPALGRAVVDVLARREELSAGARRTAARFFTETYADRVQALLVGP
jgi:glycosyltransferase involved in cell wall biosynthesis